jgi:hypothetical protein
VCSGTVGWVEGIAGGLPLTQRMLLLLLQAQRDPGDEGPAGGHET